MRNRIIAVGIIVFAGLFVFSSVIYSNDNKTIKTDEKTDGDKEKAKSYEFEYEVAGTPAVKDLIQKLENVKPEDRIHYILALCAMKHPASVPALIKLLKEEKDVNNKGMVIYALGNIRDEQAKNALMESAKDKDVFVRAMSLFALYKLGDDSAIDSLIKMLGEKSMDAKIGAISALSEIHNIASLKAVVKVLRSDKEYFVRIVAINSLAKSRAFQLIPVYIECLSDKNENVRQIACNILRKASQKDFGFDSAKWTEWWTANKKDILEFDAVK